MNPEQELAAKDAEIERLRGAWAEENEVAQDCYERAVAAEAKVAKVEAALNGDGLHWVGEPDGYMVSAREVRAAIADAPAEQRPPLFGDGLQHYMLNRALCGARPSLPTSDASICSECADIYAALPDDAAPAEQRAEGGE